MPARHSEGCLEPLQHQLLRYGDDFKECSTFFMNFLKTFKQHGTPTPFRATGRVIHPHCPLPTISVHLPTHG